MPNGRPTTDLLWDKRFGQWSGEPQRVDAKASVDLIYPLRKQGSDANGVAYWPSQTDFNHSAAAIHPSHFQPHPTRAHMVQSEFGT